MELENADLFCGSNFAFRMAPEVLQPGTGYNFKYVYIELYMAYDVCVYLHRIIHASMQS